jgi:hypothetical protein
MLYPASSCMVGRRGARHLVADGAGLVRCGPNTVGCHDPTMTPPPPSPIPQFHCPIVMLTRPFHSPLRFDTSSSCIAQHTPTATRRLTAQALEILLVNQDHQQYSPPPSTHPISSRRRPFNSEPATASSISQPTTMHQDTFEARPLPPPQHTSRHNIHHQSSKWRAVWPTGLRRLPCRPPAPQPNHPYH